MSKNLTKEQAIAIAGIAAVNAVENENCEPTNRVGYNGACQGNDSTEWSAGVKFTNADGDECTLVAYYYTDAEQDNMIAETGDGGAINWEISHYEVI